MSLGSEEAREVYEAQREELSCLSVPPARELRELHKDLWIRLTNSTARLEVFFPAIEFPIGANAAAVQHNSNSHK